jgi:two-component system LytT family response regulator
MIKAAIIDDEKDSRQSLESLLKEQFPNTFIFGEAENVTKGISLIEEMRPELVFLDIQLGDGSGFDLIQKLGKPWFEIIFVTAYDKFAIQAFQHAAFGYLLKPIDENDLVLIVNKAIKMIGLEKDDNIKDKFNQLVVAHQIISNQGTKFFLPDINGFNVINTNELIRIEGDGNYSNIYLINKSKIISSYNLGWFEKLLEPYRFFRISKSHLINLDHVTRYSKADGGIIFTTDQAELTLSPAKRELFRQFFQ